MLCSSRCNAQHSRNNVSRNEEGTKGKAGEKERERKPRKNSSEGSAGKEVPIRKPNGYFRSKKGPGLDCRIRLSLLRVGCYSHFQNR